MNYGTSKRVFRAKLPIQVPRGFNPTEPVKLSSLHPSIDAEDIKEGMVLKRTTGDVNGVAAQLGFAKTAAADSLTKQSFFIALQDGDAHDVQDQGKLVGLDCSDDFEIQTGYFDAEGGTFQLDDPLTVGDDGVLVIADAVGDVIIGYVTAVATSADGSIPYKGKTPSTAAADANYIQFKTAQNGQLFA